MHSITESHPWILGPLVIYAPNLHIARQVHELVISENPNQAFGTMLLDGGYEVDWVNMTYGVVRKHEE